MAEHAAARAGTGASALGTYAGIERIEAALVRDMAISRETDSLIGSGLTTVAGALGAPSALTAGSGMPDYGHMTTWSAGGAAASAGASVSRPWRPGPVQ